MHQTGFFTVTIRYPAGTHPTLSHEKLEEVNETASRFRGEVINELVHLEHKIETCLKNYFCRDTCRGEEFLWLILRARPMHMSNKTTLLLAILEDTLSIDVSKMREMLEYLTKMRNRLAHGRYHLRRYKGYARGVLQGQNAVGLYEPQRSVKGRQ